jgi:hypothetical protein
VVTIEAARRIADRIRAAGGNPVLIAGTEPGLEILGLTGAEPQRAAGLDTTEDARPLTERPEFVAPLDVDLWFVRL